MEFMVPAQAAQLTQQKFVSGIACGDFIDVRDSEGDWFEAKIVSITGKIAKCHFVNYSSKWDSDVELSPDKVAPRNTHSKSTGKPDHYKYLLECVHELLHLRGDQGDGSTAHAASEMGIPPAQLETFIQEGQPRDEEEKQLMISWVRMQSASRGINLKILEVDDVDTLCFDTLQQTAVVGMGQITTDGLQMGNGTNAGLPTLSGLSSLLSGINGDISGEKAKSLSAGVSGMNPGSINNSSNGHGNGNGMILGNNYIDKGANNGTTKLNGSLNENGNGNVNMNMNGSHNNIKQTSIGSSTDIDAASMRKIVPPPDILQSCIMNMSILNANGKAAKLDISDGINGILTGLKAQYPAVPSSVGQNGLGSSNSISSTSTISTGNTITRGVSPTTSDDQQQKDGGEFNIKLPGNCSYSGSKRSRTGDGDLHPASKKRKINGSGGVSVKALRNNTRSRSTDGEEEGSEYSSSSDHGSRDGDYSDDDSHSESSTSGDSESDTADETVQVPQTDGTTIRFITVSKKKFDRDQKAFERETENTKREMDRLEQIKQESGSIIPSETSVSNRRNRVNRHQIPVHIPNVGTVSRNRNPKNINRKSTKRHVRASRSEYLTTDSLREIGINNDDRDDDGKRRRNDHAVTQSSFDKYRLDGNHQQSLFGKYQTRTQELIDVDEPDDFNTFDYSLSDANLNLKHSIYPNRKFRGIAKSGKRWRARTCLNGKTQYGDMSFYNPYLAAMEYDRMIRANRKDELSGAIKTKSQIILNFPQGIDDEKIRVHKQFERHLQEMDGHQMKQFESTQRPTRRPAEEPIIDNKGLDTKIPREYLKTINSLLFETERLRPLGPCQDNKPQRVKVKHWVDPKKRKQHEEEEERKRLKAKAPQNLNQWSACSPGMSMLFGYTTLHISAFKPQ